jgi:hypothetical protein
MAEIASMMLERVEFLTRQRSILEHIFGEDWFRNANEVDTQHPAYVHWQLCQRLIMQKGVISQEQLYELAKIALDMYYFIQLTEGDIAQLNLGVFESIGDATVRKHIKSNLQKPGPYDALMVQLYVAAWHKANHHDVTLVEIDEVSWPDLRVNLEIPQIPMLIECKRLQGVEDGTRNLGGKISKIVKKANTQIKAGKKSVQHPQSVGHEHCYGVLVLDVSDVVPSSGSETDGFPDKVLEISRLAGRALSGEKNSSIHTAIIVWDTYKIDAERSLCICSRRCLRVHHTNPISIFPDDTPPPIRAVFNNSIQSYMLNDYEFQLILERDYALTDSI